MKESYEFNPVINSDFPDPDVIRVNDTYYMVSTTMYFFPGAVILRSYDLLNWEIAGHVFDGLDDIPEHNLKSERHSYGHGMWAPSLRYDNGTFYVLFTAFETFKSYIFTSESIEGPWVEHTIPEIIHDASLLIEDGRFFVTSGNSEIRLRELKPSLDGFKEDGIDRIIVKENDEVRLGYEGSHFYKINGKYYVFLIHWPLNGKGQRTEAVFISDSLDGEFKGYTVFDDDCGYFGQGVAQGGIVDTPEGDWYAVLFQDRGAIGRSPYLLYVTFDGDIPVIHNPREQFKVPVSLRPDYVYEKIYTSRLFEDQNDYSNLTLCPQWEWNHMPDEKSWERTVDGILLRSNKICANITQANNTLTQRMMGPRCSFSACVDASELKEGDCAGIAAFISDYIWVGISREIGRYFLVVAKKNPKITGRDSVFYMPPNEMVKIPLNSNVCDLKLTADFTNMKDSVEFYYRKNKRWAKVYEDKIFFALDFFTGCRFAMFMYSTKRIGGEVTFFDTQYNYLEE